MEKKFFVRFLIAASVFASTANAQTQGAPDSLTGNSLSVQQAVDLAIKNNLLVNQADITSQTSKVTYNQAWGNMLPQIYANASQGIGFGRTLLTNSYQYTDQQTISGSYSVNGSLTLFSGLYYQNNLRASRYLYQANQLDLKQQKENITLSILLAYMQVLSAQDLLNIANETAAVDQKQVQRLDAQNQEGALLLLSNLTDLRGQYAGDIANIATATNSLETAKISLFNIMNVPYKRDVLLDANAFTVQIDKPDDSPDSIYLAALRTLPNIKAADTRIRAYQKALAAARGNYYPTLSFNANVNSYYNNTATTSVPTNNVAYDTSSSTFVSVAGTPYNVISQYTPSTSHPTSWADQVKNNRQTSIGLSLYIPILNYLRARNGVKQAKINLRNTEITARSTRLVLQQNVEAAYQNMIASYKQYKAYIDQAAAFAESFRTTEIRFNEGVVNSDTYVLAKNKTDGANISLAQAKYTYLFRLKVLDYYNGRLAIP